VHLLSHRVAAMSDLENVNLVTNSQAFLMYRDGISGAQALEKLQKLAADKVRPEYTFGQVFSAANLTDTVFTQLKTVAAPTSRAELCKQLSILKFNDEERFALLMTKTDEQVKDILFVIDPMKNFLINMGWNMAVNGNTLQEAIEKGFKENYVANTYLIKRHHTDCLISSEAKSQLYWHARIGLIMGKDSFKGHPEEQYLRPNADFHIAHPQRIYRDMDLALSKMGFSIKECNEFLNQYADNIEILKEKIDTMKTVLKLIEDVLQKHKDMSYSQARAAVLMSNYAADTHLTEADFDQLLSTRQRNNLNSLGYSTVLNSYHQKPLSIPPVNSLPSVDQYGSLPTYINDNTNLLLMVGIGVGALALLLLAKCRHNRLLTAPFSMLRFSHNKIMGCFTKPATAAATPMESVATDPQSHEPLLSRLG
jgi:hypothetical protein